MKGIHFRDGMGNLFLAFTMLLLILTLLPGYGHSARQFEPPVPLQSDPATNDPSKSPMEGKRVAGDTSATPGHTYLQRWKIITKDLPTTPLIVYFEGKSSIQEIDAFLQAIPADLQGAEFVFFLSPEIRFVDSVTLKEKLTSNGIKSFKCSLGGHEQLYPCKKRLSRYSTELQVKERCIDVLIMDAAHFSIEAWNILLEEGFLPLQVLLDIPAKDREAIHPELLLHGYELEAMVHYGGKRSSMASASYVYRPKFTGFKNEMKCRRPAPIGWNVDTLKGLKPKISIKLMTYNREESFLRCFKSLKDAHYDGDQVDLHISLDVHKKRYLSMAHLIDRLEWPHGQVTIHHKLRQRGLQSQWLEMWYPMVPNEFALIVEDDLVVSPFFYRWLKGALETYVFDPEMFDPRLGSMSLQKQWLVTWGKGGNNHIEDEGLETYGYQLPGSWGLLAFPYHWKSFNRRMRYAIIHDLKPYIDEFHTTNWAMYFGHRLWTPYFIRYISERGLYTLYSFRRDSTSLGSNYREPGENHGVGLDADSELLTTETKGLYDFPPLDGIQKLDFGASRVNTSRRFDFLYEHLYPDNFEVEVETLGSSNATFNKAH